ncbi:vWA domain-containing protein [Flavobacterium lacus]|uniref:von Willebrand factor type A domain-containing protein n=1 Tax=Flavobacterium lacus TaxID=1353778 RepID=A0A328WNY5_9FLAO|nr:vWA domain-containing protein [Flavobacterium lacus]RAR48022.1 von Willebrand factor type A domain-containing protein [Flavobacterium lacus]
MKNLILTLTLLSSCLLFSNCENKKETLAINQQPEPTMVATTDTKIQVALLLDTSSSMDGLIEQAKSRLWNIVNTLTTLKYEGKSPEIQIALYEYGNSGLSLQSNYIRQITPLTTDLDLISEQLFALRTNGGSEYCGAVIKEASDKLTWDDNQKSMKLVYIAGNEPFNQGGVNYKEAIADASKKDIFINTIFCGNAAEGIATFWKDGADVGKGKYFNIDYNAKVRYIVTPYDDQISQCNVRLNTTYIGYGSKGIEKKRSQEVQDANAQSISGANYAERSVSKSKEVYKNDSWDLVDKAKKDDKAIEKLKPEELPAELKNKSKEEIKTIVTQKAKERETIQKEMAELAKKRQEFIDNESKNTASQDDLGNAMASSIHSFAKAKGYKVVN